MLELQSFPPAFGLRSASPFGVKADALLAMSGLPYEKTYPFVLKAPRKKLPVLVDGDRVVPDTAHIQAYLEREHGIDFDGELTPERRATATALTRLVEDHAYFINMQLRWQDHGDAVRSEYFADVPALLRGFVFGRVRKKIMQTLHLQGLGRHTRDELVAFGREDLDAVEGILGDRPFMLGDRPTSVDATTFAMLHGLVDCTLPSPLADHARGKPALVAYLRRAEEAIFGP